MGFFGFGKSTPATTTAATTTASEDTVSEDTVSQDMVSQESVSKRDIVAFYKRLQPIRLRLNHELTGRFPRDVLDEGAKKLGILRGGVLVFGSEDETCVLMDYCIYDVYRNGRNAVDQFLCDCPPDPDSAEMACLHAMQHATYAVIVVVEVEAGVGCLVRNMFTEETRLLVDMGFSRTAKPGTIVATRLLDFDDFITTSGAALPVGILDDAGLEAWQRELRRGVHDDRYDPAPLIRKCLHRGASSSVRYEGADTRHRLDYAETSPPTRHSARERRALAKSRTSKPATNRRCRCGSGKMVKNCCGKG